jgi:hypothetical protein
MWTRTKDGRDTAACTAAKAKYNRKHYDGLYVRTSKGGREVIQQLAAAAGMSCAEYVRHCVIIEAKTRGIDVTEALGGEGVDDALTAIRAAAGLPEQLSAPWA